MYRNYYSMNDMPVKVNYNEESAPQKHDLKNHTKDINNNKENSTQTKLFGQLEADDIILIAVVLILLADDCDDKLLLLALGFVFISGIL